VTIDFCRAEQLRCAALYPDPGAWLGCHDYFAEEYLMEMEKMKAPFPWFGGKSRVADIVWERFGGADGSLYWADPPASPFHRGVGHSAAVPCVLTGFATRRIDAWQGWLREKSVRLWCHQNTTADPLVRALDGICCALTCLLSGAPVGFLAGWGAHLALDFGSVRSLALI
jgi:hypothetical protein